MTQTASWWNALTNRQQAKDSNRVCSLILTNWQRGGRAACARLTPLGKECLGVGMCGYACVLRLYMSKHCSSTINMLGKHGPAGALPVCGGMSHAMAAARSAGGQQPWMLQTIKVLVCVMW